MSSGWSYAFDGEDGERDEDGDDVDGKDEVIHLTPYHTPSIVLT
jgi:hypothetical protein